MIHVAIISHGHEDLLISTRLGGLLGQHDDIHLWLKDNLPSAKLKDYCHQHGVLTPMPLRGWASVRTIIFCSGKYKIVLACAQATYSSS